MRSCVCVLDLRTMFDNGDISIMNVLSQDALVAKKPTIKCDIIEARNAFKNHETYHKYL